ncbi:MAG TPA: SDR family oxidoreductase [Micromonosporaceae bacterium]
MPGAIVIGAGPGLGAAIAERLAREGLPISLVARDSAGAVAIASPLQDRGVAVLPLEADIIDETALRSAIDRSLHDFGVPDVVVYNAALIRSDAPGELTANKHVDAYRVNVLGALIGQ